MSADNISIIIWFVDDHVEGDDVIGPFTDCLRDYANDLAGGQPVTVTEEFPPQLTAGAPPALKAAVCWLKRFRLPEGTKLGGNHNRNVEILAYGIDDWDPLRNYLGADGGGGLKGRPFWPHLVITDIYRGELRIVTKPDEVKSLDGYKFAMLCSSKMIPCIAITSEPSSIEKFKYLWQGSLVHHYSRGEFRNDGEVIQTMKKLTPLLTRRWWIPEFKLAVEGRYNPNASKYQVTFTKDGKVISHNENVSPVPYAFLYLCVYGSILARVMGWGKELVGWLDSKCIAVSRPPTKKDLLSGKSTGERQAQDLRELSFSFDPAYWKKKGSKDEIFFAKLSKTRLNNVLNANIIFMDVPIQYHLPRFWESTQAKDKLKDSLREILPPDGMEWLEVCRSR